MKISTKGRYSLRLMLDLALNDTGEYITVKSIAARQELSEKYLEQIIPMLSKAGYVKSIRGAQGGYRLNKSPKDLTVGMILRTIEGSLAPVACLEDEPNECPRYNQCVTIEIWQQLNEAINNVVDNISLEDLVTKYKEKGTIDYMI